MQFTEAQISAIATAVSTAVVSALGAVVEPEAPAKVTRTTKPAATKAPARKADPAKAPVGVKCLVRKNRLEFVAANPWAKGMSTYDIAVAVVVHKAPVAKGWAIGGSYQAEALRATAAQKRAVKAQLA